MPARTRSEREAVASIRQADTDSPGAQALALALRYGQIGGEHHKTWVIDQMVRALLQTPEAYAAWVADACAGEDGPDSYGWDGGIPP